MKKTVIIVVAVVLLALGAVLGYKALNKEDKAIEEGQEVPATTISWEEATALIKDCKVESAGQTHALLVQLWLKDGEVKETTEPAIDDVMNLAREAEPNCGEIILLTE